MQGACQFQKWYGFGPFVGILPELDRGGGRNYQLVMLKIVHCTVYEQNSQLLLGSEIFVDAIRVEQVAVEKSVRTERQSAT